ncbi:hypothetical protein LOTGIDRAFT_134754 [Lottia gigantea]|uniref:CR-type domain-containing protein n=1 Tax=Lottia gigantea TaxID=225164 RepID=V3ZE13_LOTGI|nr:hypothetical protein LOTGIDRAFT_134754 [Lottia gigantea]ESO82302.1 hypothetical protein LOTGIDRAFT_134754 [Lottia gigantea]
MPLFSPNCRDDRRQPPSLIYCYDNILNINFSVAELNEQQCREAMFQFVSENCCYSKGPAQEMVIDKIIPHNALHYTLETFCEGRSTGYVNEPFRGGMIDGPENGMPPPPFAIPCNPDSMFDDHVKLLEVPHTATVRPCHMCDARGWVRCRVCHGWGQNRCNTCGGDGRVTRHDPERGSYQDMCFRCHGDGRVSCNRCGGDGRVTCKECDGYCNLKCFIQMKVTYCNHKGDHIIEKTDLPDELIRDVQGSVVFEQVMLPVWPISAYPLDEINQCSNNLCNQHRTAFQTEKYLQQRQQLRAVPVTEVHYSWDDNNLRFWVYGKERKVYCPDYPKQCCCTIL